MIVKKVHLGDSGQEKLKKGIKILTEAVASTMGPGGRPVIMESEHHAGGKTITKDGVSVAKAINVFDATEQLGITIAREASVQTATAAGDGPQPLRAKILTPTGWTTMSEIKEGDIICGSNGSVQTVEGVFDKGDLELCEVKFSDGRIVECSPNHLWTVTKKSGSIQTVTTEQMMSDLLINNNSENIAYRYFVKPGIPTLTKKENNIDPLLMGLLLGDGSLTGTGSIELSLGIAKKYLIDLIKLPEGMSLSTRLDEKKNYYRVKIIGTDSNGRYIKDFLNDLGLLGTGSHSKFIPEEYLYSSIKDRNALLFGLISTDGHINKRGLFEFSTVSDRLADDFVSLICSLGMSFNRRLHTRKNDKDSYSNSSIHRIVQLSGYKYGYKIVDIRKTGKYEEMRCIKVSNDDHLYFTDGFIMTHNTTTSLVILQGMLDAADAHITDKHNVTQVVRHISTLTDDAVKFLDKKSKKVTKKKLDQVATIAANNDPELGKMISDLFSKVKVVTPEFGKHPYVTTEIIDGMKFDRGYANEYFITDQEREVAELDNPLILLTDMTIEKLGGHLESILEPIIKANRSLLIIGNMSDQARATLAANKMKGVIKAVNVIPPNFGYRQKEMMKDLEVVLGAKYYSEETGDGLHNITLDGLGTARKVIISADRTVIYRSDEIDPQPLKDRLEELKSKMASDKTLAEKKDTESRIANIEGGVGIIHVGAPSDIEAKELYDRVDDAIRAVGAALQDGILPGGGSALMHYEFSKTIQKDINKQAAEEIFYLALEAPFKRIMVNAGLDPIEIQKNILEVGDFGYGFDVKNEKYGMMEKMGVIDPTMVTKSALKNAVSVATTIMSSQVAIVNMRENESV